MATSPDAPATAPTAIAATLLEARALRRAAPKARIIKCGIALSRCDPAALGSTVISCGLAGGLRADLATGSVVVPARVRRPNGEEFACDATLHARLLAAARALGYEPVVTPLLTSATVVGGSERERWASRGYAAVDMESGLLVTPRVAVVRVILDTPQRELSPAWRKPAAALCDPRLWPQAFWLAHEAPRCARIAAEIAASVLR